MADRWKFSPPFDLQTPSQLKFKVRAELEKHLLWELGGWLADRQLIAILMEKTQLSVEL